MLIELTTTELIVLRALLKRARDGLRQGDLAYDPGNRRWVQVEHHVHELVSLGLDSLEKKLGVENGR